MNTNQWIPVLIALTLAIGSVQAFADSGWYYDEDSDTVIYSYSGGPVTHSTSRSEDEFVEHTGAWYYDEDSDTIVFNSEGSRSNYARTNPSIEATVFDLELVFLD